MRAPSVRRAELGAGLDQLQAASINYRIAIGPHAGRKALTLYSVPPLEDEPVPGLVAKLAGFSLHAGTVCEAFQRNKLERLCRYITRPPIATKRLSVDAQGRMVYRYKQPFRDGSTHVVLELCASEGVMTRPRTEAVKSSIMPLIGGPSFRYLEPRLGCAIAAASESDPKFCYEKV
jgi:hypothetical protein